MALSLPRNTRLNYFPYSFVIFRYKNIIVFPTHVYSNIDYFIESTVTKYGLLFSWKTLENEQVSAAKE